MNYPPVNQRVKKLIDFYANGSVRKFSRIIGLSSAQRLNRIFHPDKRNNKYPEPTKEILQLISKRFEMVNVNWLYTGEGEMFKANIDQPLSLVSDKDPTYHKKNNGNSYKQISDDMYKISVPLVPVHAYARYLTDFQETIVDTEFESVEFIVDRIGRGKYVAFQVKGYSMDDNSRISIPDKSLVLARCLKKDLWKTGLHIKKYPFWIIVHNSSILCKQIIHHDVEKGIITCHSLNPSPEFQDFDIDLNEVKGLFNIIKVQREMDVY